MFPTDIETQGKYGYKEIDSIVNVDLKLQNSASFTDRNKLSWGALQAHVLDFTDPKRQTRQMQMKMPIIFTDMEAT